MKMRIMTKKKLQKHWNNFCSWC